VVILPIFLYQSGNFTIINQKSLYADIIRCLEVLHLTREIVEDILLNNLLDNFLWQPTHFAGYCLVALSFKRSDCQKALLRLSGDFRIPA